MSRILLIDDDLNLSKVLSYQLQKGGDEVVVANSGQEGLQQFAAREFDIVITDIQMPDLNGIQVLQEIRRRNRQVVVIIITAHGTIDNDYLTKPFGKEQLRFVIEKALKLRQLQQENSQLRQELVRKHRFDNMVAHSAKMEAVLQMAGQVAASDATVLILGESGTGKELVARAIHYNSPRKDKPLVTVNCPSIPDNLLESELFGHVRGAFTGAIKDRKGKFEIANGGTIFLDEIGDLRSDVQAKLLRVLQEHEIERLGGSGTIKIDVRVIAATNKNLEEMVREGTFREDLYYRLSVVPIHIPPLRERKEEIPYLVDFFISRYAGDRRFRVTPEALAALQAYDWPGNVRELENVIERAVVLATDETITPESLPPSFRSQTAAKQAGDANPASLPEIEKQAILTALEKSGGNRSKAARMLQIPRHVLLYRLKKYGIDEEG